MIGGGEMGQRVRDTDWSGTPLGAYDTWPQSFRSSLSLVLNAKGIAALYWGPQQWLLYNDAYGAALGDRHPWAFGRPMPEALADIAPMLGPQVAEVLRTGEGFAIENLPLTMHRHGRDEKTVWTYSFSPVQGEMGDFAGVLLLATEMTGQVKTQAALRAEREQFASLFEQAPTFMTMLSGREHRFELANPGYRKLVGHRDILGKTVAEALPEAVEQGFLAILDRAYESGEAIKIDGVKYAVQAVPGGPYDERYLDVVWQPIKDANGAVSGIFIEGVDVTDRKDTDQALRESEERYRTLFESIDVGFCIVEMKFDEAGRAFDYRVAEANPAFERQTGAKVAGLWVSDFAPNLEQRWFDIYGGVALTGKPAHFENHAEVFGRWFDVRAMRVGDPAKHRVAIFFSDITERKNMEEALRVLNASLENQVEERTAELMKTEEALRQAQKLEAIGQLTGGVAHDFNNLLTVIRSSTDLLKRPDLSEERRQRYIGAISDTVTRAAKLTGQLLAFARRQALQPKVFDVGSGIQALAEMLSTLTGSRIEIVTDLPDAACFVDADPIQFDTAIVNMAVNARDAMQGEGRLIITVHPVTTVPAIRTHPPIAGDFVAVCIEDTGAGIAPEQMERIFEPFFTTKDVGQGTGLGLSQVFGFAKQSGGEVQVQSEVGKGTMFVLYLPRTVAEAQPLVAKPEPVVDGHGTRVLVVEDNIDVGTFTVQSLTDLGYVTVLAADGIAALAELAKGADRFDVVFSDVVMPGMSGIDLGQEIRRLHHDLPVVLTSGYSHVLAQNGTYGFELLHKPYSVEQLSKTLSKAAIWKRRKRLLGS